MNRSLLAVCLALALTNMFGQAGANDPTFNPTDIGFGSGGGADGVVECMAIQPDGKIIIGGYFSSYNGTTRNRIARLNADGSLDNAFTPIGPSISPGLAAVTGIAIQADGRIIVGGNFTTFNGVVRPRIARLNADGSLDNTFNPGNGLVDDYPRAYAIQADGKIVIAGGFTAYNGTSRNGIARLHDDGSLDNSFDPGTGASGAGGMILTTALQSDGKIIIGGGFTAYNGTLRNRIARLNTDGSLDSGFDPGTGANNSITNTALQPDGKIIIGGVFSHYNDTFRNCIARLNADGSLDSGFDPGTGPNGSINTTALQSDGKIIIGGYFTAYNGTLRNYIARLNADGSLDSGFDPGTGPNGSINNTALQSDGKIIIGGNFTSYNGTPRNRIARLNADGGLDPTFNPLTGASAPVYAIAVQPDGKTVIGGDFTSYNNIARNHIARVNADGSLDAGFDPGSGTNLYVEGITVQPDGKIIIGGFFTLYNGTPRNSLARLNINGSLDTGFDTGTGANGSVHAALLQPDGKIIIVGGFTGYDGTGRNRVARVNADGTLDTSFEPGTGANATIFCAARQADGKVIIGGPFFSINGTPRNRIARLNVDGSLDATFDPGTGANAEVITITLQADGKIIIGGNFSIYNGTVRNHIARLNADGSLDASFGFGPGGAYGGGVFTTALQTDGKIVISGTFSGYDAISRNRIARLNADGSLDTGFDPGTGANNTIYATALQADGKIVIGGSFTSYDGTGRNRIARIFGCTAGTACDDGVACTTGDVYDTNCNCAGVSQDTDSDGTCDALDGCPNDPLKTAPGGCGCGVVDVATTYYQDSDGDGYGDPGVVLAGYTCTSPPGYVTNDRDCNDALASIHPGVPELCDGLDNDCDFVTDELPYPPSEQLVGQWLFNGDLHDQTSTGNSGTAVGTLSYTTGMDGIAGGAVSLTNVGDHVVFADNAAYACGTGGFAVSYWFKTTTAFLPRPVVDKTDGSGNGIATSQVLASMGASTSSTNAVTTPNGGYNDGQWHHMVFTREGGALSIYMDGSLAATTSGSVDNVSNNQPLRLGGPAVGFQGSVDNLRLYARALSAAEVTLIRSRELANLTGYLATETCNGQDDDCDGLVDEGVTLTWYQDADGDGYGNASVSQQACTQPPGYVSNNADCNDTNPGVSPSVASDPCGGADEDCDGWLGETPVAQYPGQWKWLGPPVTTIYNSGNGPFGGSGVARDAQGNLYTVDMTRAGAGMDIGCQGVNTSFGDDMLLTKTAADGTHQWSMNFGSGGSNGNDGTPGAATQVFFLNGEVILPVGLSNGSSFAQVNGVNVGFLGAGGHLLRLTPNGAYLGDLAYLGGMSSNLVFSGGSFYWGSGASLKKYTPGGSIITLGLFTPTHVLGIQHVAVGPAGDVFVSGVFGETITYGGVSLSPPGVSEPRFTYRIDPNGTVIWARPFYPGSGYSGVADAAGNYYLATGADLQGGVFQWNYQNLGTQYGSVLLKVRPNGDLAWSRYFNGSTNKLHQVHLTADQKLMVLGYNPGSNPFGTTAFANRDQFLLKLDTAGTKVWMETFGIGQGAMGFTTPDDVNYYVHGGGSPGAGYGCVTSTNPSSIFLGRFVDEQTEVCNGLDDDCDGFTDAADASYHVFYADGDGDTFGGSTQIDGYGTPPPGYALTCSDCNDANNAVNPNALELCNNADDNCDGLMDAQLPTGLAFWMPFSGSATDIGPNAMPGAVTGATLVADRFGVANKAYRFNGTNDRIEVPANAALHTPNVTVSCWVKFNGSTGQQYQAFVAKTLGGGALNSYVACYDQNISSIGNWSCNPGFCSNLFTSNTLLGGWRHFTLVFDDANNMMRIYLDGVQVNSVAANFSLGYDGMPLTIGCEYENNVPTYFANADIDEVMVFGRALSASEIMSVYRVTNSPEMETQLFALDADGDQWYSATTNACAAPAGYVLPGTLLGGGDCNDASSAQNPGASEVCNGVDDNCDGVVDMLSGLMLYLPFNGDANDASGQGHHGTVLNATLTTGHAGAPNTAYQFNGSNARIDVPDHADLRPPSLTHSVWIRYDAVPGDVRVISGKPNCPGWSNSYGFWFQNGQLCSGLGDGPTSLAVYSFPAPSTGQWHHCALTFDDPSNVAKVYIDNVLAGTFSFTNPVFYDGTQVTVGQDIEFCAPSLAFNGRVDEVTLFDRALNAGEIAMLYAQGPVLAEVCNGVDDDCDGLVDEGCYVYVTARAMLDGPYNTATGLMNDALRSLGTFPLSDPYPGLGYTHAGSGNGGSVAPAVIAAGGNNAIVDWVVLELRSPAAAGTVVASRSALLQRDGDIVDLDGTSPVSFAVAAGNYHVAVRHRNHLGCMTAGALALSSTPMAVDFTLSATSTYGTDARKTSGGAVPVQTLWAGDVTFNHAIKYTGSGNDRDPILVTVGSTTPNNVVTGAYSTRDVNLNGDVKYTGSGNDRDPILVNVGSTTPNSIRVEQLP